MEGPLNIERDVVKNGVRLDCVFEGLNSAFSNLQTQRTESATDCTLVR